MCLVLAKHSPRCFAASVFIAFNPWTSKRLKRGRAVKKLWLFSTALGILKNRLQEKQNWWWLWQSATLLLIQIGRWWWLPLVECFKAVSVRKQVNVYFALAAVGKSETSSAFLAALPILTIHRPMSDLIKSHIRHWFLLYRPLCCIWWGALGTASVPFFLLPAFLLIMPRTFATIVQEGRRESLLFVFSC